MFKGSQCKALVGISHYIILLYYIFFYFNDFICGKPLVLCPEIQCAATMLWIPLDNIHSIKWQFKAQCGNFKNAQFDQLS